MNATKERKKTVEDIDNVLQDIDRMNAQINLIANKISCTKKCKYFELHPEGVTQIYN